uniref:Uncharacterized protein n=1 Tax=Steinernema glaseri TaxID=37863 RepID=A0A1I7Y983_9BILA
MKFFPFSDVGTPSKIRVTSTENNDPPFPKQISPPQQIEEIRHVPVSPPLPSLLKRMEQENTENPFRPDEVLFHEVDPIVEAYRTKPYPPSNPSSPVHSPTKNNRRLSGGASPQQNGGSSSAEEHERLIKSTTVDATDANGEAPTTKKGGPALPDVNDISPPVVSSEQPGRVEMVHIDEKKRKCACCSIQ